MTPSNGTSPSRRWAASATPRPHVRRVARAFPAQLHPKHGPGSGALAPGRERMPPGIERVARGDGPGRGVGCPMCGEGRPDATVDGVRFYAGDVSDAYLRRTNIQRGLTVVIWRGSHVAEPTELAEEEAQRFLARGPIRRQDARRSAPAGQDELQPARKLDPSSTHAPRPSLRGRPSPWMAVSIP
jgi:hypothetical protein